MKVILAPMVRIGTLPMRLLALKYGADLVYSEELVDHKFILCQRVANPLLGTIDFVSRDQKVLFRTCAAEKDKVIFQIGTADPERALKVAQLVQDDVAGIDVNMGCPKSFSLQGGMGAALLQKPELAAEIVSTLVKNIRKPITCKIRLLETIEDTINLVQKLAATGVTAIAVHARFTAERPRDPPHYDYLKAICSVATVPIIINGVSSEIQEYNDIQKVLDRCGASSVMLARSAQWNPSVFRKEGLLSSDQVIAEYLKFCIDYDNYFENTKYVVSQMLHQILSSEKGQLAAHSKSMESLCEPWDVAEYAREVEQRRGKRLSDMSGNIDHIANPDQDESNAGHKHEIQAHDNNDPDSKRQKKTVEIEVKINARLISAVKKTPRTIVYEFSLANAMAPPIYETREDQETRCFKTDLIVNGIIYSSQSWMRSKKVAEQAAAIVFILNHSIPADLKMLEYPLVSMGR